MTTARWHRLNELFHAALDQPPELRETFIADACGDDELLRAEVRSLLQYHEQATSFLEHPPADSPQLAPEGGNESLIGQRLGQYLITRKLGQGGMGVVYLADDTRLGRVVALKALTPQFKLDDRRRERLRREARAAAVLSHPGIATVYALEEFDDHLYIISEYVPGETLREELARGPLPWPTLVDTAIDVAKALAAAHQQGIVHRDLKPDNVIRTLDGATKVLDFGLARFHGGDSGGVLPSVSQLTEIGTILGTPAYMSPEQLRGWQVDARADVFSFGVMIYELATGIHPFAGSDPASTIARVLEVDPPPVSVANRSVGRALDDIIAKCLKKDREERYPSARELAADLEGVRRTALSMTSVGTATREPADATTTAREDPSPLWWWQVHQLVVSTVEFLMLIPLWRVRSWIGGTRGAVIFFGSLAAVSIAATLRLHLRFTSRYYPRELTAQRAKSIHWIRWPEIALVTLLLVGAASLLEAHAAMTALLAGIAIGLLLSLTIIEPATTRAAFRKRGGRPKSGTRKKKS